MKLNLQPQDEKSLSKLIHSLPIGSTKDDVRMRSAVISFSFGPKGIIGEVEVEDRDVTVPTKPEP